MWTCTNTVWRKQSSLPEENQVHHGTPGLLSDALGRIVDIGNKKTGFREKANSRCLELCHRRVPLMFFHDAQAELILSLRGRSRTRAEPREQPKGKIMGSLISQKLSWRITSFERFYKKKKMIFTSRGWTTARFCTTQVPQLPAPITEAQTETFVREKLHAEVDSMNKWPDF